MNPALGGALTALGWGSADFIARFTGRALGHVTALFAMLGVSAVILTAIVLGLDVTVRADAAGWWLVGLMGVGLMIATALLYQALVRGPVTIVAPIVGSFPAFNIVLALVLGVRPSAVAWAAMLSVLAAWAAMLSVLAGVVVVARATRDFEGTAHYTRAHLRKTVWLSLASSVTFAVTVAAGQEAGAVYGELGAVCIARWVSFAACGLLLALRRELPRVPMRWWPVLAFQGVLDGGAYVALLAGSEGAGSAITAVVASTFSAVTVILARLVLREPMTWFQWIGVVMILAGVATLSSIRG